MNSRPNPSITCRFIHSRVTTRRKMASLRVGTYRRRYRAILATLAVTREASSAAALLSAAYKGCETSEFVGMTGAAN